MNFREFSKTISAASVGLVAALNAPAQVLDNPVAIPVSAHFEFESTTTETLKVTWFGETSSLDDDVVISQEGQGTTHTGPLYMMLRPGVTYELEVSGNANIDSYILETALPSGYDLFLSEISGSDLIERKSYVAIETFAEDDSDAFKILIRPNGSSGAVMKVGEATSWSADRLIWEVGMGQLKNGNSAGAIRIQADDFSTISYEPSDLNYSAPSTEVSVVFDSTTGDLRQINAPQALADIIDGTGADEYEIRFYSWKDVTGWNGTVYTVTGNPFVTYEITKPTADEIDIKKTFATGSDYYRTRLRYLSAQMKWEMYDWTLNNDSVGNSMRKVETTVATTGSGVGDTKTTVVSEYGRPFDSSNDYQYSSYESTPSRRTRKTSTKYGWGWELTKLEEGFDGTSSALRTTTYEYYTSTNDGVGHYGQLKKTIHPDGGYTRHTYYDSSGKVGLPRETFSPFEDNDEGRKTTIDYSNDGTDERMLPSSIKRYVKVSTTYQQIAQRLISYGNITKNGEPVRRETITDYASTSDTDVTTRYVYREDASDAYLRGQPFGVIRPDGTRTSYAYYTTLIYELYDGVYTWRTYNVKKEIVGTTSSPAGGTATLLENSDNDDVLDVYVLEKKSTAKESWFDISGMQTNLYNRVYASGTTLKPMGGLAHSYDSAANLTTTKLLTYANNSLAATNVLFEGTYANLKLVTEVDAIGNVRDFVHDRQGRVEEIVVQSWSEDTSAGTPAIAEVVQSVRYNGANQKIRHDNGDASASETIESAWSYDIAGRLASKTLDCCQTVTFQYPAADQVKTINPDGGYVLENYYEDGTIDSVTGDATIPRYVRSRYESGQMERWSAVASFTVGTHANGWRIERYDWLGRTEEVYEPVWDANNAVKQRLTENEYEDGLLKKVSIQDNQDSSWGDTIAPTIYDYDALGRLESTALDINNNGAINPGTDRNIVENRQSLFEDASGYWWASSQEWVYPIVSVRGTSSWKVIAGNE